MRTLLFLLFLQFPLVSLVSAEGVAATKRTTFDSPSFQVRTCPNGPSAFQVSQRCEVLRDALRRLWLGTETEVAWQPRCQVVIHPTRASYQQAVGRASGQTSGSSLIRMAKGRPVTRRIDLLVDHQMEFPALAHELTHVVLADRFQGRQPPRWVDEGIATMSDSLEKRLLHRRDFHDALSQGRAMRVIDVLRLEQFTSAQQVPVFYGQSLSLVHFLVEQDTPGTIVDFAEAAMEQGYDLALKQYYGIDGVAALERRWRDHAANVAEKQSPSWTIPVGHRP